MEKSTQNRSCVRWLHSGLLTSCVDKLQLADTDRQCPALRRDGHILVEQHCGFCEQVGKRWPYQNSAQRCFLRASLIRADWNCVQAWRACSCSSAARHFSGTEQILCSTAQIRREQPAGSGFSCIMHALDITVTVHRSEAVLAGLTRRIIAGNEVILSVQAGLVLYAISKVGNYFTTLGLAYTGTYVSHFPISQSTHSHLGC